MVTNVLSVKACHAEEAVTIDSKQWIPRTLWSETSKAVRSLIFCFSFLIWFIMSFINEEIPIKL